jgi:hypothetical protein
MTDNLTLREQLLLEENKRLRQDLIRIADHLDPDWRDQRPAAQSDWILKCIQDLEQDRTNLEKATANLLDILSRYEHPQE